MHAPVALLGRGSFMNSPVKFAVFFGIAALVIGLIAGSAGGGLSKTNLGADVKVPTDQTRFTAAITSARASYQSAANELAAGGVRRVRQKAICDAVINQRVSDWVGKITTLTSSGDGHGVISIAVGPFIQISTWYNSFSDGRANTLIDPGSPLFKTLMKMKVGDTVKFSGRFFASTTDCVDEQSFTLQGSMSLPVFTLRFSSIQKLS